MAETRTIALTPYMGQLLTALPRVTDGDTANPFVFASSGKSGRLQDPGASHAKALPSAGISLLTVHGLRPSFPLLGEAAGAPAGAISRR